MACYSTKILKTTEWTILCSLQTTSCTYRSLYIRCQFQCINLCINESKFFCISGNLHDLHMNNVRCSMEEIILKCYSLVPVGYSSGMRRLAQCCDLEMCVMFMHFISMIAALSFFSLVH